MAESIPHPLNARDDDGAMRWAAPDPAPVVRPGVASGFAGVGPAGLAEPAALPPPITLAAPWAPRWAGDPEPDPGPSAA